jgi:signal transduction histidine kinase
MIAPENKGIGCLEDLAEAAREEQRLLALAESGLLEAQKVPVFEEATQAAADFLETPICIAGLLDKDRHWLKAAVGMSELGHMTQLPPPCQIKRSESFCARVVESGQVLAVRDTAAHPAFSHLSLVQEYGVRAYLGVPLLTESGHCLGALAVMDLAPRTFTRKQIQFLELTARWTMSELELQQLKSSLPLRRLATQLLQNSHQSTPPVTPSSLLNPVKAEMLTHLTQDLRTPLTSVMGMTSVLRRGIYGPLTNKQKEYLGIINDSGRHLLSQVEAILALEKLSDSSPAVQQTAADIEMLCQQVINALEQDASRREQEIRLSVEPGNRIWVLDKIKVQQMLYHLVYSVIQAATTGSVVRIHVCRKLTGLKIAVWVSHPWLGEGIPLADISSCSLSRPSLPTPDAAPPDCNDLLAPAELPDSEAGGDSVLEPHKSDNGHAPAQSSLGVLVEPETFEKALPTLRSRESLGLLLSCLLAEIQGGDITIQGSSESGYRYTVSLPQL